MSASGSIAPLIDALSMWNMNRGCRSGPSHTEFGVLMVVIAPRLCSRFGHFAGLREMGMQEGANDIEQASISARSYPVAALGSSGALTPTLRETAALLPPRVREVQPSLGDPPLRQASCSTHQLSPPNRSPCAASASAPDAHGGSV
eukprot:5768185-Amphidinium_carterae.1